MAQTTTQQQMPSQPVEVIQMTVTSENSNARSLPGQATLSQGCEVSRGCPERRMGQVDSARQHAANTVPSNQSVFWRETFPRVANTCGILGLLLVVIFGIPQWLTQDKSIAIARESELVTLALSCSDEKIKHTAICQQFFEKYPNGPAISRRENVAEDRKAFLQNIASLKTGLTRQQADNADPSLTTTGFTSSPLVVVPTAFLVAWVILILKTEIGLFISLGLYVCVVDPVACWMLLQFEMLKNWVTTLRFSFFYFGGSS